MSGYAAELSLIQPFSEELWRAEPFPAPTYVSLFRDARKSLAFVGADHVSGADNPTIRTIEKVFHELQPQSLVLEGFDDRKEYAEQVLEHALRDAKNGFVSGERAFAVWLAHGKGVPFVGGEPTDRETLQAVLSRGLALEDWLGFYVLLFVPQWNREGRWGGKTFEAMATELLQAAAAAVGEEPRFGFQAFMRWYERTDSTGKRPDELTADDMGPNHAPGASHFQRVCCAIEDTRESRIVRRIEAELNRHDRVMAVYGSSHLAKQRKVWERMLGKASDSRPF